MFSYKCNEEEKKRIMDFAVQVVKKREDRNSRNNDRGSHRLLREIVGKIGEVAAQKKYGGEVDWNLYENDEYKHDPDLVGTNYFVKTCSVQEAINGISWLIDKSDQIVTNPTFQELIFACADPNNWTVKVLGDVHSSKLLGHYGPARSKKIRKRKVAVWCNDFILTCGNGDERLYRGIWSLLNKTQ